MDNVFFFLIVLVVCLTSTLHVYLLRKTPVNKIEKITEYFRVLKPFLNFKSFFNRKEK